MPAPPTRTGIVNIPLTPLIRPTYFNLLTSMHFVPFCKVLLGRPSPSRRNCCLPRPTVPVSRIVLVRKWSSQSSTAHRQYEAQQLARFFKLLIYTSVNSLMHRKQLVAHWRATMLTERKSDQTLLSRSKNTAIRISRDMARIPYVRLGLQTVQVTGSELSEVVQCWPVFNVRCSKE